MDQSYEASYRQVSKIIIKYRLGIGSKYISNDFSETSKKLKLRLCDPSNIYVLKSMMFGNGMRWLDVEGASFCSNLLKA